MYLIRLKNCAFFARHGLMAEEAAMGQRFYVDATLSVDPSGPLESDSIDAVVDYGEAFKVIETIVTQTRRALIETLALDIAKALCTRFPAISSAEITVRKPSAPVQGVLDHVEVTVAWPQ